MPFRFLHSRFLITASLAALLSACGAEETSKTTPQALCGSSDPLTYESAFVLAQQTTFGPKANDLVKMQRQGACEWIERQMAMPSNFSYLDKTKAISRQAHPGNPIFTNEPFNNSHEDQGGGSFHVARYQMDAWWHGVLDSPDQLRHRVAYSLSQLLVVSVNEDPLHRRGEALAHYNDILMQHAFGNYRDLLWDVSLSPAMGFYLSANGNRQADDLGARPDENFARELMQLFTIGLTQLNSDGSNLLDSDGNSIPAYTHEDVLNLARVMTGWEVANERRFGRANYYDGEFTKLMRDYDNEFGTDFHDSDQKQILGHVIPAGGTATSDLQQVLDILFEHPNTAARVAKHLITNLVVSNPEPEYVERVAAAFSDNGKGVRGDMAATIKAVLLDDEADRMRKGIPGKLVEPLIRLTQMYRTFDAEPMGGWKSTDGEYMDGVYHFINPEHEFKQGALRAPSVFNWYSPDFTVNVNGKNEVMPEAEIMTDYNISYGMDRIRGLALTRNKQLILSPFNPACKNESGEKNKTVCVSLSQYGKEQGYGLSHGGLIIPDFDEEYALVTQTLGSDFSLWSERNEDKSYPNREKAVHALVIHLDKKLLGSKLTDTQINELALFFMQEVRGPNGDLWTNRLISNVVYHFMLSQYYFVQG